MCGICGIFKCGTGGEINADAIHPMTEVLRHRGPDNAGYFTDRDIVLGHRRLSIIDLDTGNQPMCNEDESVWVVYNGEIYNYKELKSELESSHEFKTNSDTEIIVHLYEAQGASMLSRLRGMFSFALWDKRKNVLLLARDRIGKKPLYYTFQNNCLLFASELKSIMTYPGINRDLDMEAMHDYLTYRYIPAPRTIYKNIKSLEPAEYMLCGQEGKVKKGKYWHLRYDDKLTCTKEECERHIVQKLRESVKIRLMSDVPLGAFLSGGIDSAIIVGLMSKLSASKVKTFTVAFRESEYSEHEYAKIVSRHFDTEHNMQIIDPLSVEQLPKVLWNYDQPYGDPSALPSYFIAQSTSKHVKVVLTGDGGDETFAGYLRYRALYWSQFLHAYFEAENKVLKGFASAALKRVLRAVMSRNSRKLDYMLRFIEGSKGEPSQRNLNWHASFSDEQKMGLYSEEMKDIVGNRDSSLFIRKLFEGAPAETMIDRALYTDFKSYLPGDLMVKMDIACMANSLEARSPFLDHEFVGFAARIPDKYKIGAFDSKIILKNAFRDMLPPEILNRRKMGFGVPVDEWFRGKLKGYISDTLLSRKSIDRGYFTRKGVESLINEHQSGKANNGMKLWTLLCLELWHGNNTQ